MKRSCVYSATMPLLEAQPARYLYLQTKAYKERRRGEPATQTSCGVRRATSRPFTGRPRLPALGGRGDSMLIRGWQYLIAGLMVVAFVTALVALLISPTDKTAFVTVIIVATGGLVLVAALPQLSEFSVGLKGVTAKLARVEDKVDEQQRLINELVHYSMSASVFHHLCGIAILHTYEYSNDESSRREMYFLRDHGFIKPKRRLISSSSSTSVARTSFRLQNQPRSDGFVSSFARLKYPRTCST